MLKLLTLSVALILLAGCQDTQETSASRNISDQKAQAAPEPLIPIEVAEPLPPPIDPPPPNKQTVSRDLRPCPGMDIRRPAGTNCYGILPSVCGADKAAAFIGQRADATVRKRVIGAVISRDIRWIKPGDAVIENFSPDRLNIMLDAKGRIESADCY